MKGLDCDIFPQDEAVVQKLAALAHPVRLRLLRNLGAADSCCVKDLVGRVGLAQSTVSQHLKILVEAELVTYRSDRQRSCYTLNTSALQALADTIGHTLAHCCGGNCSARALDGYDSFSRLEIADASSCGHKDI